MLNHFISSPQFALHVSVALLSYDFVDFQDLLSSSVKTLQIQPLMLSFPLHAHVTYMRWRNKLSCDSTENVQSHFDYFGIDLLYFTCLFPSFIGIRHNLGRTNL